MDEKNLYCQRLSSVVFMKAMQNEVSLYYQFSNAHNFENISRS